MNALRKAHRWLRTHVLEPLDTMYARLDDSNDERSDTPPAPSSPTDDGRTAKLTRITPTRHLGRSA